METNDLSGRKCYSASSGYQKRKRKAKKDSAAKKGQTLLPFVPLDKPAVSVESEGRGDDVEPSLIEEEREQNSQRQGTSLVRQFHL